MTEPVDRRRFLTYTGAAGAATGALWVAPSVLGSSSAFALNSASDCTYAGKVVWSPTTSNQWTDGSWVSGDLISGRPSAPPTGFGSSKSFVAKVGGSGNSYVWVKFTVGTVGTVSLGTLDPTFPGISDLGGENYSGSYSPAVNSWYRWAWVPSSTSLSSDEGYTTTIEFFSEDPTNNPSAATASVENLAFTLVDIDSGGPTDKGYRDMAYLGGSVTNFSGTLGSTVSSGTTGTSGNPWIDTSPLTRTDGTGNVDVEYNAPVSALTVNYFNYHGSGTKASGGSNGLAIGDLSWGC